MTEHPQAGEASEHKPDCPLVGVEAEISSCACFQPGEAVPASDLLERLREGVTAIGVEPGGARPIYSIVTADQLMREAADTIAGLEAELAEIKRETASYREALSEANRLGYPFVLDALHALAESRKDVERLRIALSVIDQPWYDTDGAIDEIRSIARRAREASNTAGGQE